MHLKEAERLRGCSAIIRAGLCLCLYYRTFTSLSTTSTCPSVRLASDRTIRQLRLQSGDYAYLTGTQGQQIWRRKAGAT